MARGQVVRSLRDRRLTRRLRDSNPEAQSVAAAAPLARTSFCPAGNPNPNCKSHDKTTNEGQR
jgi:hypothetical protein